MQSFFLHFGSSSMKASSLPSPHFAGVMVMKVGFRGRAVANQLGKKSIGEISGLGTKKKEKDPSITVSHSTQAGKVSAVLCCAVLHDPSRCFFSFTFLHVSIIRLVGGRFLIGIWCVNKCDPSHPSHPTSARYVTFFFLSNLLTPHLFL